MAITAGRRHIAQGDQPRNGSQRATATPPRCWPHPSPRLPTACAFASAVWEARSRGPHLTQRYVGHMWLTMTHIYVHSVLVSISLEYLHIYLLFISTQHFFVHKMGTGSNVLSQQLPVPGEQVLDLEVDAVDASASLQQLIPRVFEALGPLRPLRLLLSDGRSWQETSCRELGAAGYPSWGENDELLVDAGDAEVGKQRETHLKKMEDDFEILPT